MQFFEMSGQLGDKVPGAEHYSLSYLSKDRIFSYAHQIDSVLSLKPRCVVEVGAGGGMVTAALRATGMEVTTVDVQRELNPDIVASVTHLPFDDNQLDVALCCQVLEHLPFDQFKPALRELWRVSRLGVIVSLPDASPYYEVRLRLPKLSRIHWSASRHKEPGAYWRRWKWDGSGHYWEIGYSETPLKLVANAIVDVVGGVRVRTWRAPENPYHRFFSIAKLEH